MKERKRTRLRLGESVDAHVGCPQLEVEGMNVSIAPRRIAVRLEEIIVFADTPSQQRFPFPSLRA